MNKLSHYVNNNLDIGEEYSLVFGKSIPTGKMFCLWHNNINTPAAKRYGNIIKCFGTCNKAFSVYDLLTKFNPERLTQLKETLVLNDVDNEEKKPFCLMVVNRNKPISSILNSILEHYQL